MALTSSDLATLFLESLILAHVNGTPAHMHPVIRGHFAAGNMYDLNKPIHQEATNVYKTRDGRFYHLHGSMNAGPTMAMLGVDEQECSIEAAIDIYASKVAQHDAAALESLANDEFRQAGVTCLTTDEYFASEQGKIMAEEPLWTTREVAAQRRCTWPEARNTKPLDGIRVIDFSRVIAAPVISKMLALLGAQVIKVTNANLPDIPVTWVDLSTGKRDADIDLKTPAGKQAFIKLVQGADVLINGYRPGVLDKLGFPASKLRELNPTAIYARENCYGFKGPLAHRSGWQQISDCHVGVSWLQGEFLGLQEPVVPLLRTYLPRCVDSANNGQRIPTTKRGWSVRSPSCRHCCGGRRRTRRLT